MVITLIGYRGTGKTTVARALAAELGWNWADADDAIETTAGRSIQEIFADAGESAFREIERAVMKTRLQQNLCVLATGGGAVLDEKTRQDMQAAGPVIWLKASPETILTRIQADETTAGRRPNLTEYGGRREVEELLAVRTPLYEQTADTVIDTDGRSVDEIVGQIMAFVEPSLREGATG